MLVVMHVSLWTDYLLSCDLSMIWVDVEQELGIISVRLNVLSWLNVFEVASWDSVVRRELGLCIMRVATVHARV